MIRIIQQVQLGEIYKLGAQSHVAVSFEAPKYKVHSDVLSTLRILEEVLTLEFNSKTCIYQASTSELNGRSTWQKDFKNTQFDYLQDPRC